MNKKNDISKAGHRNDMLAEHMRHAQEQLAEMQIVQKAFEDIFLSTAKSSNDLIVLINSELQFRYVSPSSSVITGYSPDELLGRSCLEHIHSDDVEKTMHALSKFIEKGTRKNSMRFRVRHKNGTCMHIDADALYLPNASDFGSIIIHYRNITEQRLTEQQIIRQKQLYEAILDTIYDGVCVTDSDDTITYINKAFMRIMDMHQDDIIGTDIVRFFSAKQADHFHKHYRSALVTITPVNFGCIHATTATGVKIYLSGWCIPRLTEGTFDGMICTFTDISEQQKIEGQLSESETRFRSIAETATDGIITVKNSGEVIFWNSAATHIFGYNTQDVAGKDIYKIMPEHIKNNHRGIFAEPEQAHREKAIGRTIEGQARKKDGSVFPIELSLGSWMIGKEAYFTAIIRDITHRKHIEQSLQQSEQELKNLSSRLLHAHEQERKRIAYELHDGLGQILSAAKIGIKTILGSNAQVPADCKENSPGNLLSIIQSAIDEVRRISRDLRPSILDDLGIIAAVNSFCLDFERVNSPITVIRDIEARDEDIPEHITIAIYRVTQEACTNIARHSRADRVTVKLSSGPEAIQLSIHDNGTGFDVKSVQEARGAARGLGLSSMKERVELSGGLFTLTSSPNHETIVQALWEQSKPAA